MYGKEKNAFIVQEEGSDQFKKTFQQRYNAGKYIEAVDLFILTGNRREQIAAILVKHVATHPQLETNAEVEQLLDLIFEA